MHRTILASLGLALGCGQGPTPPTRQYAPEPTPTPAPAPVPTPAPSPVAPRAADPSKLPLAAKGDASFAAALFDQVRKAPGNVLVSPTSVRLALAMTARGAAGTTADELYAALALPAGTPPADLDAGLAALLGDVATRGDASTLRLATRLWPQRGKPLQAAFVDDLAASFGAAPEPLDFAAAPGAAREAINAWVAAQTMQHIPTLLAPEHVTADTRLVLTSAVYLKARWATPFDPKRTTTSTFITASGAPVPVQLMQRVGDVRYGTAPTYEVVELPYADGSLAMQLLLPRDGHTLAEVEATALTGLGALLQNRAVDLQVPRLTLRFAVELRPALEAMGVRAAFTAAADFHRIDGGADGLYVGHVVHAADLVLDEAGTEAAAATAVAMPKGGPAPTSAAPIPFIVNRPAMVLLRDGRSGTVLFVGRIADPSA